MVKNKNIANTEIKKGEIVRYRSHNWVAIRKDYIQGYLENDKTTPTWPNQTQLARKYNMPANVISTKATNEKWAEQRSAYVLKLEKSVQDKRIKNVAKQSFNLDSRCYNVAISGIREIEDQINFFSNLIDADGERKWMSIEFMDRAARTIEKFQRVGRIALGLSPNNESTSHNVQNIKIVSFSEGLDKVMQHIKSNPELHSKLKNELID